MVAFEEARCHGEGWRGRWANSDVLHLGNSPDAVPQARQFVAAWLTSPDLSRFVDDAELAVAELVTNALLHAAPPVSLRVVFEDDRVRVEVSDGSRATPVRGRADVASMTGRGLALVEALSLRWGVEPAPEGKTVWAEIGETDDSQPAPVSDLDGDIDALLAAWADDEPAEEHFVVRLGDVPDRAASRGQGTRRQPRPRVLPSRFRREHRLERRRPLAVGRTHRDGGPPLRRRAAIHQTAGARRSCPGGRPDAPHPHAENRCGRRRRGLPGRTRRGRLLRPCRPGAHPRDAAPAPNLPSLVHQLPRGAAPRRERGLPSAGTRVLRTPSC